MRGLYVHIPFCNHICAYCDFYKMVASDQLKKKTIDYMIREMDLRQISKYSFDTIYIGGGSPSSLSDELFEYFLFNLSERVLLSKIKEFTVEFNPSDITLTKVLILKKYHVSRVSIGVQSFHQRIITKLGRIPFVTRDDLKDKITLLNSAGITNINVDLIYAVDDETLDELCQDIEDILSLNVNHLSSYSLILEEHTILNYQFKKGRFKLCPEEIDEAMYFLIDRLCKKHNIIKYETSNYAKKGYRSKHNLLYWHNEDYLGIGPAASSHMGMLRFTNTDKLKSYFKGIDENHLCYKEFYEETYNDTLETSLMMGLRLMDGINEESFFQKYQIRLSDAFNKIDDLITEGLLERTNGFVKIPNKYSYIANYIIGKLLT